MDTKTIISAVMTNTNLDELRSLSSLIVSRINSILNAQDFAAMQTLKRGDKVSFDRGPRRGGRCQGFISRFKGKSIEVIVQSGDRFPMSTRWTVSPSLLTKVAS